MGWEAVQREMTRAEATAARWRALMPALVKGKQERLAAKIQRARSERQTGSAIAATGKLLRDPNLTFAKIAGDVGVSRQRVQQIQKQYFPHLLRARRRK